MDVNLSRSIILWRIYSCNPDSLIQVFTVFRELPGFADQRHRTSKLCGLSKVTSKSQLKSSSRFQGIYKPLEVGEDLGLWVAH
jgi:hypothetical protein